MENYQDVRPFRAPSFTKNHPLSDIRRIRRPTDHIIQDSNLHVLHRRLSDLRSSAVSKRTGPAMDYSSYSAEQQFHSGANEFTHPDPSIKDPCTECITDCLDASCPSVAITSQCTDQCVVICDDPTHSGIACEDAEHCDASCNVDADCHDCTGFEEFVSSSYYPFSMKTRLTLIDSYNVAPTTMHTFQMPDSLQLRFWAHLMTR